MSVSGVGRRACGAVITRLLFVLSLGLALPANAAEVKIATWNLNWLTTRPPGDHGLPADVTPRADGDFTRLARYAQELNADLVAIQEVDGFAAATRIFPRDQYSVHMTRDHVVQRVGIAVRRGLKYDVNPDVVGLSANHLRSGADITVHLGSSDLRVLAVHLKTGCWSQKLPDTHDRACVELREQIPVVADWIATRRDEGIPFIVLGDFNRRMNGRDAVLTELREAAPLVRATEGQSSPCWGGGGFYRPHPGWGRGGTVDGSGDVAGDGLPGEGASDEGAAVGPLSSVGPVHGAGLTDPAGRRLPQGQPPPAPAMSPGALQRGWCRHGAASQGSRRVTGPAKLKIFVNRGCGTVRLSTAVQSSPRAASAVMRSAVRHAIA